MIPTTTQKHKRLQSPNPGSDTQKAKRTVDHPFEQNCAVATQNHRRRNCICSLREGVIDM